MEVSGYDVMAIACALVLGYRGYVVGTVRSGLALASLAVAVVLGRLVGREAALSYVSGSEREPYATLVNFEVGGFILFLALTTLLIRRVSVGLGELDLELRSAPDRAGGAALGMARGGVVAVLIVMAAANWPTLSEEGFVGIASSRIGEFTLPRDFLVEDAEALEWRLLDQQDAKDEYRAWDPMPERPDHEDFRRSRRR